MMTYNMTELHNADTIFKAFNAANIYSEGNLFGLLIVAIFFVILMVQKKGAFVKRISLASYLCFILSGFLAYSSLIPIIYPLTFLIMAAVSTFIIAITNN